MERRLSELALHFHAPTGRIVSSDFERIDQIARNAGITYDLWQKGLLTLLFSRGDDGRYLCGESGLTLSSCRQIGKTYTLGTSMFIQCLLKKGLTVIWTAHHSRTSDQTFNDLADLAEGHGSRFHPYIDRIRRANGQQEIRFTNGSAILFGAREHGFGRGLHGADMEIFDEAQILSVRALDNLVPVMNTAADPLVVFIGNPPKPGDPCEVFSDKRRDALAGRDGVTYIELSADPDCDSDDRDQWERANPSYPHRTSEAAILRMRNTLSEDSFRREALGIWDKTDVNHAIDHEQWAAAAVQQRKDGGAVSFAVDMPPDRSSLAVGACMMYPDKTAHIELAEYRDTNQHGIAWAVDWLAERWPKTCSIVIDAQSPATVLLPDLKRRGVRVTLTNATDMGQACGRLTDWLRDGKLRHLQGQEALDIAVTGATKRNIGQSGAFAWNKRTADVDISPLVAVTLALHGAATTRRNPTETRRVIRLP
ncbi:terminase [Bifidobacterium animalis]|uniref:terminase n=1 Tax=Bifidobacterium animalis TaxID=28025 RepID=UPI001C3F0070|nr:terminase [Bifidobacterium animalis]MCR1995721.1 terminase [Bifidobacterium animalis subsp. animalis]